MLKAPLEQFEILSFFYLKILNLDFSITNFLFINTLIIIILFSFILFNFKKLNKNSAQKITVFFTPNVWQKMFEYILEISTKLISGNITKNNDIYYPFTFLLFNFILFNNLIGLIPYTFTATSHVVVTFTLSFSIFIGKTIICFKKYKMKAFSLFLPANSAFLLSLILVPIEFISYIARPISLGMRLFINLMAGHSLLKVIIGFAWNMLLLENLISIGFILPMVIIIILIGLELAVALIQTYVFIILTCIYIQDVS